MQEKLKLVRGRLNQSIGAGEDAEQLTVFLDQDAAGAFADKLMKAEVSQKFGNTVSVNPMFQYVEVVEIPVGDSENLNHVCLLKVYDKDGQLLPNVMPFRTEQGAEVAAADLVPEGCRYEIVNCEISE